jgi:hypothetical protein
MAPTMGMLRFSLIKWVSIFYFHQLYIYCNRLQWYRDHIEDILNDVFRADPF